MSHPEPEILDALAYGMLEDDASIAIRRHVKACAACRAALSNRASEAGRLSRALRPRGSRPWLPLAAAAALAVAVLTSLTGGTKTLDLPDGSRVTADGSVRVEGRREIACGPGEYEFYIVEGSIPFRVQTPGARIEVKGTRFRVRVREETVKGRTALVTLVAVASGTVALANFFGWIELGAGEAGTATELTAPRSSASGRSRADELTAAIAAAREREADLGRRVEAGPAPAGPVPGDPETPVAEIEVPAAVLEAARRTGASEAALEAAFRAFEAARPGSGRPDPEALPALAALGADGFRGVVALLAGGLNGTWFTGLVKATWSPGLEDLLIEVAEDPDVHQWSRWSALRAIGEADTEAARDYLVARIERERNPGLFMCAAQALAALSEPRGSRYVDDRIMAEGWSGVRGSILHSLGRMGGDDAHTFLVRYLRDPHSDQVSTAVSSLARIAPEAAAREARSLLAGPREPYLSSRERRVLRSVAGEDE